MNFVIMLYSPQNHCVSFEVTGHWTNLCRSHHQTTPSPFPKQIES